MEIKPGPDLVSIWSCLIVNKHKSNRVSIFLTRFTPICNLRKLFGLALEFPNLDWAGLPKLKINDIHFVLLNFKS